ncbi:TrbC/VirB2 family protein [Variovorax sp. J22R24]|uniref:TrbC/VirB2 family protein n=1 Tax=Variovorax gracilis TaxID=3053502 RepID=UPI0025784F8D|nr:TrbC/VirB2 family protein [Variovorax sp. J22R24]MDM0108031.1 TrbC/VirB2 family protein [Variovorax sp. J22R24]
MLGSAEDLSQPGNPDHPSEDAGNRANSRAARASGLVDPAIRSPCWAHSLWVTLLPALCTILPDLAQAGSPFATGANATQQQLTMILTPIAAVAVMVSGAMAWFGRLSWWWMVAVVIGTVLVFGGPQIVSWIRGLFGV